MTLTSVNEEQAAPSEPTGERPRRGMRLWLFLVLSVLFLALIGGSVATAYFFYTEAIASAETSLQLVNQIKRDEHKIDRVTHQMKEYGFDVSAAAR